MMPTGFRFNPTDEELIEILERKVCGQEMPIHGHFIVERNIYVFDPQDLERDYNTAISNTDRYCYYLRENDSREVLGRGWWRATGHVKKIYRNEHIVGYRRPLTFHRFDNNDRNRNKAIKTNWIMHEYSLESNTTEWRLCKIKYNGKQSVQNDHKSRNKFEASSSITGSQPNFVGEQSQPQPSLLNSPNYPYFEPIQQLSFAGEEQLENQILQLENVYDAPYFTENLQMELIDEQQQQLKASFDPLYYFEDHLAQPAESFEEQFTSLWSWQNKLG